MTMIEKAAVIGCCVGLGILVISGIVLIALVLARHELGG